MLKSNFLWALALGSTMVLGCNKENNKTPPAAPTPVPQATKTPTAPESPGPSTRPTVPEVPVPALPDTAPAKSAAEATPGEAQSLMDKAQAAIEAKNWNEADSILNKLEAIKGQLTPDMQNKLATLKTAIDTGKGAKLPGGLPGLPSDNK